MLLEVGSGLKSMQGTVTQMNLWNTATIASTQLALIYISYDNLITKYGVYLKKHGEYQKSKVYNWSSLQQPSNWRYSWVK